MWIEEEGRRDAAVIWVEPAVWTAAVMAVGVGSELCTADVGEPARASSGRIVWKVKLVVGECLRRVLRSSMGGFFVFSVVFSLAG